VFERGVSGGLPPRPAQLFPELHPSSGTVEVLEGSRVLETITVGDSGRFSLRLPPGPYRLQGDVSLPAQACDPTVVRARPGEVESARVFCVAEIR
jgi:hypothetical protein